MAGEVDVEQKGHEQPLISAAWLSRRLGDPGLVVVDASVLKSVAGGGSKWRSGHCAFETAGHIPGARFADQIADFSDTDAPFAFTRPPAARFAAAAAAIGLSAGDTIVAYDSATGIWAARLWWLLRAMGHDRVAVLDGGLNAWVAGGRPLERGAGAVHPAVFTARERPGRFVDAAEVLAIVEGRAAGRLVCVLRPPVFSGAEQRYARPGHIPGSLNLPHQDLLGPDNRFLPIDELRKRLSSLIASRERIVLYCGGGVTAAGTALALTLLGVRDIAIYEGSLSEWSADPALPMVAGLPEQSLGQRA